MNCTRCGYPFAPYHACCPVCGEVSSPIPAALPAPRKARNRLPYLLLTAIALFGLLLYILLPLPPAPSAGMEAAPNTAESLPPESKALFQKDCFLLMDGVLQFDESRFIPNPILIVPAAIENQPVTAIGEACFRDLQGVTTIILPSSVTTIGDSAFSGCGDLRGICVPNAVTKVGQNAFLGCSSLEAIYLPTGLNELGEDAFAQCPLLTFVFYNGYLEQWQALYPAPITPYTWVICWDGEYRHVGKTP